MRDVLTLPCQLGTRTETAGHRPMGTACYESCGMGTERCPESHTRSDFANMGATSAYLPCTIIKGTRLVVTVRNVHEELENSDDTHKAGTVHRVLLPVSGGLNAVRSLRCCGEFT